MSRSTWFFGVVILLVIFSSCAKQTQQIAPPMTYEDSLQIAEDYVAKGVESQKEKDYAGSIVHWNKALEILPNDAELYNFIGVSNHRLEKYDLAVSSFKKAIDLRENYVEAINNLGYMYFLLGNFAEAKVEFEKAIDLDPTYQQAVDNLRATNDFLAGKMKLKSYQLFQQAAKSDSLEEQIAEYQKALSTNNDYAEAHNNLGVAFYYQEEYDSTLFHLKKAIEIDPKYSEAMNNLGFVYNYLGQTELAEKYDCK